MIDKDKKGHLLASILGIDSSYQIMHTLVKGETVFMLAVGTKSLVVAKVAKETIMHMYFDSKKNDENLKSSLDTIEETHEEAVNHSIIQC